ncbi:MAG: hypothetical protein NVS1B10_02390 [Candidatus Saccharimonadales bacterium]
MDFDPAEKIKIPKWKHLNQKINNAFEPAFLRNVSKLLADKDFEEAMLYIDEHAPKTAQERLIELIFKKG